MFGSRSATACFGAGRSTTWASLVLASLLFSLFGDQPNSALASRHRPGPVFIRGTITSRGHDQFTLVSPSKGPFRVVTSRLTTYWEKTRKLNSSIVQIGNHVGVHGYVSGRTLQAVRVTLYVSKHKSKPKEHTLRGYFVKAGSNWIDVSLGRHRYHFSVPHGAKIEYRLLPAKLTIGRPGQRVDVRFYQSGRSFIATRVELLVIHVHHPRAHTIYGTVTRVWVGGFILETIQGHAVRLQYRGRLFTEEEVSVRLYTEHGRLYVEKVHHMAKLPVHTKLVRGQVTSIGHAWLRISTGSSSLVAQTRITTKVSKGSLPSNLGALSKGQYVSVRFWMQGRARIATSIHIYSHPPTHPTTGAIRGTLISFRGGRVMVRAGKTTLTIEVASLTDIHNGAHKASAKALAPGQDISVRYYSEGRLLIANSIHIYVSRGKEHTLTGTVLSVRGSELRIVDREIIRLIQLTPSTIIRNNGKEVRSSALRMGQKVRVTALEPRGRIEALRVDILPNLKTKTGHLPTAFRGTVAAIAGGFLILDLTKGGSVRLLITHSTRLIVSKRYVPMSWLFTGPTASVSVSPRSHGPPVLLQVEFHPLARTVTGNVASRTGDSMTVEERSNVRSIVSLEVAAITDDGERSSKSSLLVGLHVQVKGFTLPSHVEAALDVAITHPSVRMSGTVIKVVGSRVDIRRTSGQVVLLRFPPTSRAFDKKTSQWFKPGQIPLATHLSIRGVQEAGWISVKSADLTLKSAYYRGVVSHLGPGLSLNLALTTSTSVMVHARLVTKVTEGRQPITFSGIEIGDSASIRAYPDSGGGVLASSIDLHRKLVTRTGYISNLSATSLDLVLKDGTDLLIYLSSYTEVEENGVIVSMDQLANGEKVHVEAHLRPDGYLDAVRIEIETT